MTHPESPASARTRVRRVPERGRSDRETIEAILDEALVCHVGVVSDGSPVVIPMACARDGDRLLLHGSTASRLLKTLASGADDEDMTLDIWAGEIPLRTISLDPLPDPLLKPDKPVPESVERFRRERVLP